MADVRCLFPDCPVYASDPHVETAKREVIAHTNAEHAEAQVLIACAHELKHVEDFGIVVNPQDGRDPYEEANSRYRCVRCGDEVVKLADPPPAERILKTVEPEPE